MEQIHIEKARTEEIYRYKAQTHKGAAPGPRHKEPTQTQARTEESMRRAPYSRNLQREGPNTEEIYTNMAQHRQNLHKQSPYTWNLHEQGPDTRGTYTNRATQNIFTLDWKGQIIRNLQI